MKQFSQIHQGGRNKDLLNVLRRERELGSNEPMAQILYRHQATTIVEDAELYRAEWVSLIC